MDGKTMLMNCSQEIKDIIIERFGSLEDFYGFVCQLNEEQYVNYKKTHKFDNTQIDRLKDYLENAGVDFMAAGDIVEEIGADFSEQLALNQVQSILGINWQEKLQEFYKLIGE